MARKKGGKALEDHIAELEAVVGEIMACPACGKTVEPDATTCPHCGAPIHEEAELHAKAAESLEDLGKHLDESVSEGPPAESIVPPPPPEDDEKEVLASAAALAAEVRQPEVVAAREFPAVAEAAAVSLPEPEVTPEPESRDLEGFIASIEAEVGVEPPARVRATTVSKPAVRTVRKTAPSRAARSSRWAAAVAGGAVLYLLSLILMTTMERVVVASFMVVATFLVAAGIGAKPSPPGAPPRNQGRAKPASEYLCPLCGTEIAANASMCPTCGAVFEA